jgi:hypothetical protein
MVNARKALKAAGKLLTKVKLTRSVVLTRITYGARNSSDLTAGQAKTSTTYPCKGFETSWSKRFIGGVEVAAGDRFVALLGYSLAVTPKIGDTITIGGVTAPVIAISSRDDAQAAYVCLVRG